MAAPRILIAEDDPGVRMTLEFLLKDEGFEVMIAADGEVALATSKSEQPDLILLDQKMPKLDGKQVLEGLRADRSTKDIPVMILTGMTPENADEWAGTHFFGKPFSPDALIDKIRSILEA